MGQHTKKITNPNQSEIPFLNSCPEKQGTNPNNSPKKQAEKSATVQTLCAKFVWLSELKLYITKGS